MDISCKKCSAKYRIDDSKIPAQGAKVKCPKCGEIAVIKKEAEKPVPESLPQNAPDKNIRGQASVGGINRGADAPPKNPLVLFESQIKNIQRLIFFPSPQSSPLRGEGKGEGDALSTLKDTFGEMLKSYQSLKKDFSKVEKSKKEMETLVEVGKAVNSVLDMDQLLNLIMDMVIKVVGAERGFLMLKDKETGELIFKVARNMEEELKDKAAFTISSGITSRVAKDGKAILSSDAKSDERFSAQASVMGYNLRSLMCVPLKIKDEVIGTIYVDNRAVAGAFTDETLDLLSSFANQSAIAIENARLYENVAKETKIRSNLQRYLSPNIVNDIMTKKENLVLGGERVECSILFTDICGFTSMSEKLSPETVVQTLNEYFSEMTKIIFENEGTLDKFIGDAIMASFGTPIFNPHSAQNAVKAGICMLKKLEELQKKWESEGRPSFKIRIGINTGDVVAGNIGSPDRMDYTVIGDNVNLASRLESNAKPMTVLISDSTYIKIKDMATVNPREPIMVKGKSKPVQTYEVTDIRIPVEEKAKVQRKFVRRDVSLFATFKIPPATKTNQCIIQNISGGGLLMSTRGSASVGEKILLDFTLPDQSKFDNIEGKIAMARPFKDEHSNAFLKMGIEFTPLSDTDFERLSAFCNAL
ncbi:MAG: zinc-ribbon domain-containing protein [Nitrospinae bacterium]|nr:zinc-ribbon domain-containing protein [Nitrospinota bacterium]